MQKWLALFLLLAFSVSSPLYAGWLSNDISITHDSIASNITSLNAWCVAGVGDTVLNFTANTSSGLVYFNLSGFNNSLNYDLEINSTYNSSMTSDSDGMIYFTDDSVGNKTFTVVKKCLSQMVLRPSLMSVLAILKSIVELSFSVACTCLRCKYTGIFLDIRILLEESAECLVSSCASTLSSPICHQTLQSFGRDGTSPCQPGSAITFTFL